MGLEADLHPGEVIVRKLRPSAWYYSKHYIMGVLLGALTFFLYGIPGILYLAGVEIFRRAHTYYLTNRRVVYEYSLIRRHVASALFGKIQDLRYSQTFIERLCNIGTVYVNTAGTDNYEVVLFGVDDPGKIKALIESQLIRVSSRARSR